MRATSARTKFSGVRYSFRSYNRVWRQRAFGAILLVQFIQYDSEIIMRSTFSIDRLYRLSVLFCFIALSAAPALAWNRQPLTGTRASCGVRTFTSPPDSLPGTVQRSSPPGTRKGERYRLWLFPCNDSRFTPHMERIMDEYVLERVKKGSRIVVTGHTDIVGEEMDNLELSRRRAANAAAYMRKKLAGRGYATLEWTGVGEEQPLYPNHLPEMRFYNRTVEVRLLPPAQGE